MATFSPGDKVTLKSSPFLPVITIIKVNDNGSFNCKYETDKHNEVNVNYHEDLLQPYVNPATIYRL